MHNVDVTIAVIIFFVAVLFQPLVGLALTIVSIPLPLPERFFLSQIHIGEIVFALSVAAFLCVTAAKGTWRQNKGYDLLKAFVPFALIALVSGAWSLRMPHVRLHRVIGQMLIWAEIPVAYFLARNIVKDKKTCMIVFSCCFAVLALFSVAVLGFYITEPTKVLNPVQRLVGGFDSPNTVASYLSVMLPLGFGLLMVAPHLMARLAVGLPSILAFFLLLKTYSRGAIVSLCIGMLVWLVYGSLREKSRKKIAMMATAIVLCVMITVPLVKDSWPIKRLYSLASLQGAKQERILLGRHAFALARKHLFLGVGPGNYLFFTKAKKLHYRRRRRIIVQPLSAHNLFFKIFAETGIFGLLAFLYFLKRLGTKGLACLRALQQDPRLHMFGMSVAVTIIVFLLHNMVDVTMRHGIAIQLGIHMGLLNVLCNTKESEMLHTT